MKLALLSTALFTFSTLRAVAIPHIIPDDKKDCDTRSHRLDVRGTNAVRHIIPDDKKDCDTHHHWLDVRGTNAVPTLVWGLVSTAQAPIGDAIQWGVNKIQELQNNGTERVRVDTTSAQIISVGANESISDLMTTYADGLVKQQTEGGISFVLTQEGAIISDGDMDYNLFGVGFQDANGQISKCIVLAAENTTGTVTLDPTVNLNISSSGIGMTSGVEFRLRGNITADLVNIGGIIPKKVYKFTFNG